MLFLYVFIILLTYSEEPYVWLCQDLRQSIIVFQDLLMNSIFIVIYGSTFGKLEKWLLGKEIIYSVIAD